MERRSFLKNTALVLGAASLPSTSLLASTDTARRFEVTFDFDIPGTNAPVNLWNPLPFDASYQKLKKLTFNGDYQSYNINSNNAYDTKILFTSWDEKQTSHRLHVKMMIETSPRKVPLQVIKKASEQNLPIPQDIEVFLQPTTHVPKTDKITAKVAEITKGMTDRFAKVEAIYDWICENTFRDPKVIGCGVGDAGKMMETGYFGGKCTDISSLFVAFLRAADIPAREVFGIRLGKSEYSAKALGKADAKGFAKISGGQHCRVEYYIPGAGWVPSDPADVTKLILVEGLKLEDARVQELKKRYLHSWEMNWVGFNWGRDFVLSPQPIQYPNNMLGYPYAEIGDEVANYYNPKGFAYNFTSQEV